MGSFQNPGKRRLGNFIFINLCPFSCRALCQVTNFRTKFCNLALVPFSGKISELGKFYRMLNGKAMKKVYNFRRKSAGSPFTQHLLSS